MKKFKNLNSASFEILSSEDLSKIKGGQYPSAVCQGGGTVSCSGGEVYCRDGWGCVCDGVARLCPNLM